MEKQDIKSLTLEELTEAIRQMGDKPFRAKQIYQWLHQKLVADFDEMSNLSKPLREKLKEQFVLTALYPADVKISQIDGTRKYLFRLADGNVIESVWMQYHHGNSVCISSQVGCRMGCRFCASTLDGLERNLTPAEMLDQIYRIQTLTGERVSNIVIMGSGAVSYTHLDVYKRQKRSHAGHDERQTDEPPAPGRCRLGQDCGRRRARLFLSLIHI